MPDPCNFVELHLHVSFKHLLQFHKACIGGSSRFTKINSQLLEDLGRWPNRHECHAIPKKKRLSNIVCDKHYFGSGIVPNPCQLAFHDLRVIASSAANVSSINSNCSFRLKLRASWRQ